MLKKKPHIEERKAIVEKQLAGRQAFLESAGMTADGILQDVKVRHFRAKLRQARRQLADIAELEETIARKAEIKSERPTAQKAVKAHKKLANPQKKRDKRLRKELAATAEDRTDS